MPYVEGRVMYDADSHIMELPMWLHAYIEPEYRDRLQPLALDVLGADAEERIEAALRRGDDAEATRAARERLLMDKGWDAYGASIAEERSRALDLLGYAAQLVFSTAAGTQFAYAEPDVAVAGLRAHNRGMADFCSQDRRLIPVGILPWVSGEYTLRVLEEALDFGCRVVFTPQLPTRGTNSPTHPEYEPVWRMLEERRVPFVTHLGGGQLHAPKEFHRNGIPVRDFVGGGENMRAKDFPRVHHDSAVYFAALIFDGLFDRHPGLRGGCIEQGACWVVSWLRELDLTQQSFARNEPVLRNLRMKPSEYARKHLGFTPFAHEDVGWMIEQAGPELFLFSSDFPHPEGGKDPVGSFDRSLRASSAAAKEAFFSGNFLNKMGAAL